MREMIGDGWLVLMVGFFVVGAMDLDRLEYVERGNLEDLTQEDLIQFMKNTVQNYFFDIPIFHLCGAQHIRKAVDYTEHFDKYCLHAGFGGELFITQFGDRHLMEHSMVIKKARIIGEDGILFPLQLTRHFGPIKSAQHSDIPWEQKT